MQQLLEMDAIVFLFVASVALQTGEARDCVQSDQSILKYRAAICESIVSADRVCCGATPPSKVDVHRDWPNQAVYMKHLLTALLSNDTCLNTTYARSTANWMNADTAQFYWTWDIFQVQYYDMPRKPGVRIEAPDTLGRKCWAVAYLKQIWETGLREKFKALLDFDAANFTTMYDKSIPTTMDLCTKVRNNCFVNASYDPSRAGSCSGKLAEFYLGFQRENALRGFKISFPWTSYTTVHI